MPMSSTVESQVGVEGRAAAEGARNIVARKVKRLEYAVSDGPEPTWSGVRMANAAGMVSRQCVVTKSV